jgi:hypothetical protein
VPWDRVKVHLWHRRQGSRLGVLRAGMGKVAGRDRPGT